MKTVGFYVKAGVQTGYGHIVRCLALANELERRGARCVFDTNKAGADRISGHYILPHVDYFDIKGTDADVWIIDLEDGVPLETAEYFRPLCKKLAILNGVGYPDGDPGRLLADLVFYQGVTGRPYQLDWTGFNGEWFVGPEYIILREQFRRQYKQEPHDIPRIVVTGGGSDPKGVAGKAVNALLECDYDLRVIVGPANGFTHDGVEIVKDPLNMAEALAWADVAVISYGMTAFECLALGIPTVALSISPDHKASADLVQRQSGNALISLSEVESVMRGQIRLAVCSQLARQATLSKQARAFVDGRGAERVAGLILESLSNE